MKKLILIIALLCTGAIYPCTTAANEQPKVILVLGSGGSRALAHVGVIEELEKMGVVPDLVVGCSAGAIVGALYAEHGDIAKVKEILIDLKYDDLVDFSFFQKYAFSSRNKLADFLKENLKSEDFSALKIPFIAVVTDLQKGEPVYFQEGDLHMAVLASAALPGLFPPMEVGEELYVDGGICDPLPVRFAQSLGNAIVIASDIRPSLDGFEVENLPQVIRKSLEVVYQRLYLMEREEADFLLEMNFTGIDSPIEDGSNHEIYEKGKEVVRNRSDELRELLDLQG